MNISNQVTMQLMNLDDALDSGEGARRGGASRGALVGVCGRAGGIADIERAHRLCTSARGRVWVWP